MMNHRERFLRTIKFEEVDTLIIDNDFGLMPGLLERWHDEGLPESVKSDEDIKKYFDLPPNSKPLPLNVDFDPPFETGIIEETDEYVVSTDWVGRKAKMIKASSSISLPMEFPVTDFKSWEDYKRRLQFHPGRVDDNLEKLAKDNIDKGLLNYFATIGFYWRPRDLLGDEGLCIAYYEQPELVRDIVETCSDLIDKVLRAALERIPIDVIHMNEDMAYKNASMIGKRQFDEFVAPYYKRIDKIVKEYGVGAFVMDTDGCFRELSGWLNDCGVQMIGPNEAQANNDIIAYRKRFGKKLAFYGGIDKKVLASGRDAIEAELTSKIPFMKETGGGWIISPDHRVIKETPLSDFQYFIDRAKELAKF